MPPKTENLPEIKHFRFNFDKKKIKTTTDEATGMKIAEFEGYGSVFGNVDSWDDIVDKGSFLRTLSIHKAADRFVKMLNQHAWRDPIGFWPSLEEDNHGLYGKGAINLETNSGRDVYSNIVMGIIDGLSIGFETVKWFMQEKIRHLQEVKLYEISPVVFPANEAALISGVKSALVLQGMPELEIRAHLQKQFGLLMPLETFSLDSALATPAEPSKGKEVPGDAHTSEKMAELISSFRATIQKI